MTRFLYDRLRAEVAELRRRLGLVATTGGGGGAANPHGNESHTETFSTETYVQEQIAALNVGGAAQSTFLVSGGQIVWIEDYDYIVSAASYYINAVLTSSPQTPITLTAAHATLDRLDVVAVDDTGSVVVIDGTPASQPAEPDVDPSTQLKLGIVFVAAATTEPATATTAIVYAENAGGPGEWNWTSSGSGWTLASTNNPRTGTKDIEATTVTSGAYIQGQISSGTFDPNLYGQLVLYIRSKANWTNNRTMQIRLQNAGVVVGATLTIGQGQFGFDSTITASYQQIAIPISQFAVASGSVITQVRLTRAGSSSIGFYLDDASFVGGGVTQPSTGITQEQADARYARLGPGFVTIAAESTLPNERRLAAGTGVSVTDNGPGNTVVIAATGGTGDVTSLAGSTDNAIVRYHSTTGDVIQNSTPTVEDDGRIDNLTDPTSAQNAATKAYVDAIAVNLGKRARVRVATTAPITISTGLNNGDSLDGVTLATGDLVLVKDQAAPEQNGVYVVGVSPNRATEFDTYDEHPGSLIAVQEGTANADTLWLCTSNVGGTLNTTAIAFSVLSVSGGITQLTGAVTAGPGSGSQAATLAATYRTKTVIVIIGNRTVDITTGRKYVHVSPLPAGTITAWRITSPDSGSIVIDVLKGTYAGYPTVATITGGTEPELSSVDKDEDTVSWAVSAGDILDVEVLSCSGIKRATLSLTVVLT